MRDKSRSPGLTSRAWLAKMVGRLFSLAALGFVGVEIYRHRAVMLTWQPGPGDVLLLSAQTFFYGASLLLLALNWHILVVTLHPGRLSMAVTFRSYTYSQIAKYVPGNVAHLLGRHLFLLRQDIGNRTLAMASLIELILLPVSALLVALLCIAVGPFGQDVPGSGQINAAAPFLLVAVGLAWGLTMILLRDHTKLQLRRILTVNLSLCLVFMTVMGANFALTMRPLAEIAPAVSIGAATLAWLIGFLTPGSPGGIGTREATFLLLLRDSADAASILLAIVLFRLVTIGGDLACFGFGELTLKARSGDLEA